MHSDDHILNFDFDKFKVELRGNFPSGDSMLSFSFYRGAVTCYPKERFAITWERFIPGFMAPELRIVHLSECGGYQSIFCSYGGNDEQFFKRIATYLGYEKYLNVSDIPAISSPAQKQRGTLIGRLKKILKRKR